MSAVCCPVVLLLVSVSCRWQRLCGSAPRLVSTLVGGCLSGLGERDEVSSSANPGALDGQLWQLSGQRAGPLEGGPQRTPGDASKKHCYYDQ